MKRFSTALISIVLVFCATFSLSACNTKQTDKISTDPKELNVKIYSGGYGTTYISELEKKFEALYEEEGYKINILAPRNDLTSTNVYQDIYSDSGVDVYFATGTNARDAVAGSYGVCFADVTESVLNAKPIKFDGTEEETTVKSKINTEIVDDLIAYDGKYYALPYATSAGGIAVNKKILDEYELELPKTSDELFGAARVIMEHAAQDLSAFPFTYSTSGNYYFSSLMFYWMIQYGGKDEYDRFWSMLNADGSEMGLDAYKVFDTDSVREMFTALYEFYDYNMAAPGSTSQDFTGAQAQIMRGKAVFYSVGDFMFNEEYNRFPNNRNDITFIKTPVISALGRKLFGSGGGNSYNFSDEKSEQLLRAIIDGADEGKEIAEIKTAVDTEFSANISADDILEVCKARGFYTNNMGAHAFISEKSDKKDIAALFLRMCASEDGGALFARESRTGSPFAPAAGADSEYEWVRSARAIPNEKYAEPFTFRVSGYREKLGLTGYFPPLGSFPPNNLLEDRVTVYNDTTYAVVKERSVYADAAKTKVDSLVDEAKRNLETGIWKPVA